MEKSLINITRVNNTEVSEKHDVVICEHPFTIYINNEEFITLLCTPKDLKELIFGFLFSEGFINNKEDVYDIYIDDKKGIGRVKLNTNINVMKNIHGKRIRTTGCGKGTIFYNVIDSIKSSEFISNVRITYEEIIELMKELNKLSKLFLETGGVHTTMLATNEKVLMFYEDIGRHNTVDKIIGSSLLNEIDLFDKVLFTSGRISSELLIKTIKANIPIIVSRSAPTDLAVKLAKEFNITLVGFVRGSKLNIYNDNNRILLK